MKYFVVVVALTLPAAVCTARNIPKLKVAIDYSGIVARQTTDAQQKKTAAQKTPPAIPEPCPIEHNSVTCQQQQDEEWKRKQETFNLWLKCIGVVQAIALFLTIYVIARQTRAMKNSERAWVAVKSIANPPEDWVSRIKSGYIPGLVLQFAVYGKTVVRITDPRFTLRIVPALKGSKKREPDLPTPPDYSFTFPDVAGENRMVIPPDGTFQLHCLLYPPLPTEAQVQELLEYKAFMCAYGFVRYTDAFGKDRETRACYVYDFAFGGVLRTPDGTVLNRVGFQTGGPPEYNRAT